MAEEKQTILSNVLRKRLEILGYASLKKFHGDRKELGLSYELLRQVVYGGRVPRTETLLSILQALRFSPAQTQKVMEYYGRGYPRNFGASTAAGPAGPQPESDGTRPEPNSQSAAPAPGGDAATFPLAIDDPEEIASTLFKLLPKIPLQGNEDFWDTLKALVRLA